jgi:hypothetical protein
LPVRLGAPWRRLLWLGLLWLELLWLELLSR